MRSSAVVVTGFDNTKLGKQTIVVTCSNRQLTFEVEVVQKDEPENPENPREPDNPDNPENPGEQVTPVLSDLTNMRTRISSSINISIL